jgi:hypothetical protein
MVLSLNLWKEFGAISAIEFDSMVDW